MIARWSSHSWLLSLSSVAVFGERQGVRGGQAGMPVPQEPTA